MAVQPYQVYENSNLKIVNNTVDLANDTLGALLLVDGHTVDLATHQFVSNVVSDEVPGGGDYARQPVAGQSISLVTGETLFDINDISFGDPVTISARYIVIYKNSGNDATSEVLFISDLTEGGNASSTDGKFDIANPNGVHKWVPNQ